MNNKTHRRLLFAVSSLLHAAVLFSLAAIPCPKKVGPIEITLLESPPSVEHGQVAPPGRQEGKARVEERKAAHGTRREKPEAREVEAESAPETTAQSLAQPLRPEIAMAAEMGGGGESQSLAPRGNGQAGAGRPPGGGAANPAGDDHALPQYLRLVRERIARYKKYPPLARKRELEGRVGIRFLLTAGGEVERIAISRSSGQEVLDQAALKAVRDGAPFPRPPADLLAEPHPIELTIVFTLS